MGKVPVVMKKFIPGYIANGVQGAIWLEVTMLLDKGYASARDIMTLTPASSPAPATTTGADAVPDALFAERDRKLLALKRACGRSERCAASRPLCRQNGMSPHTVIRRMMRVSAG